MEYLFKSAKSIPLTTNVGFTFAGSTFSHKAIMLTGTPGNTGITFTIIPIGSTFGEGITFAHPSPAGGQAVSHDPYIFPLRAFKIWASGNCTINLLN